MQSLPADTAPGAAARPALRDLVDASQRQPLRAGLALVAACAVLLAAFVALPPLHFDVDPRAQAPWVAVAVLVLAGAVLVAPRLRRLPPALFALAMAAGLGDDLGYLPDGRPVTPPLYGHDPAAIPRVFPPNGARLLPIGLIAPPD